MLKGSSLELKGFNCKNIRRNSRGDSVISMLNSFKASRSPEKHRETRYRRYLEKNICFRSLCKLRFSA